MASSDVSSVWFAGDVASAVMTVKRNKGVLIVLVYDDSPECQAMVDNWQSKAIRLQLDGKNCVALKLLQSSASGKQFTDLYAATTFPTTYFIGCNGEVLDSFTGLRSVDEISQCVAKHVEVSDADLGKNTACGGNETAHLIPTESKAADAPVTAEKLETKVDAIRKELRMKKLEEDRIREQLKRQIEADRREKQRFRNEKQEAECNIRRRPLHAEPANRASAAHERVDFNDKARVQCRFSDGSRVENTFDKDEKFEALWNAVRANMNPAVNFKLVSLFQHREYTAANREMTMKELGFTPTAVLMVVPEASGDMVSTATSFDSLLAFLRNWILKPVWNAVYGVVSWILPAVNPQERTVIQNGSAKKGEERSDQRRGRLNRNDSEDDDPNAVWNGNSTQQL